MSQERNWSARLPSGERLYTVLAVVVIVALAVLYLFFINGAILPAARARREQAEQLTAAEQALIQARRTRDQTPDQLQAQIATAQAELEQAALKFLSEPQAAEMLDQLSQYAGQSGVEISNLETLPGPEKVSDVYDVRKFQLQLQGAIPALIKFVSLIQDQSLVIDNVSISEGDPLYTLALDVTLYTSPYASGTAPQPTLPATPPVGELTQLEAALNAAWAAKDWAQAIDLLNQMRAIAPASDDIIDKLYSAYVNYGYQLLDQGDAVRAAAQFNAALSVKPAGTEAQAGLAQAQATPVPTLTAVQALNQQLDQAWAAKDWPAAIHLIEQILLLQPGDADTTQKHYAAFVNYGYQLAAENLLEEAKEAFIKALEINPQGGEAAAGLQALAAGAIPTPQPPTPTPSPYITYIVKSGDTLFSIARRYNTTVQAIMSANGLTSATIQVGQQLRIPTGP